MPRHLILGTGTEIGKTFVTAALARALSRLGSVALAVKPVETGFSNLGGDSTGLPPEGTDARLLEDASFHVTPPRPHPLYALAPPISPHLAARRAGIVIRTAAVARWLDSLALHDTTIHVLVETAGGAFSPLSDDEANVDLRGACDVDRCLLVAPDAIGVLHDVRATVIAMKSHGTAPDAIVLTASRAPDASTGTNAAELRRLALGPTIWEVRHGMPEDAEPLAAWLQTA